MDSIIDRLLNQAERARRAGHLVFEEVCRDAADELGLVIEERNSLKESHERVMTALEKALARLNEVEALRIGLDDECNQLRESLSIADMACRTYWGWEYGRPGDEDDDDIPDSSLLVKWRTDYVKRK